MWITRKKHLCIVQELKYEIEELRSDNAHIRERLKTAMELYDFVSRQNSELRYAPLHKIISERLRSFWQNFKFFLKKQEV